MADQNVNIAFKTTADIAGAEDAKDSLEALTKEMKAGEKAAAEYNRQLEEKKPAASFVSRAAEVAGAAAAIGYAARAAGQTLMQVKDALATIDVDRLRQVEPEMAKLAETAKGFFEGINDPIGKLLEIVTGDTVKGAFKDMNDSFANLAKDHGAHVDRLIANGIKLRDELKNVSAAMAAANRILDAKDTADKMERDIADQEAIRAGAAPEDVKAARAQDDAKRELARIDRNLTPKIREEWGASDNYFKSVRNRDKITAEGGTPEDRGKAQKQVDAMLAELERVQRERATAEAISKEERRAVQARAEGRTRELEAAKADRLKREEEKANEDFEKANRAAALEFASAANSKRTRRQRDQPDTDSAGRKVGREAAALLPQGVSREFAAAVQRVSKGLQDGDQGGELKELLALMNRLADATAKRNMSSAGDMAKLRDKVANIEGQVSNLRSGK